MSYPNDNFASATEVFGDSGSITPLHYDGIGDPATSQPGETVLGAGETLWWKWTATFTGTAQVNTRFSPSDDGYRNGLDTKIGVYTDFFTIVGSDDDDPDPPDGSFRYNTYVEFAAEAGTTYWFQVDMYSSGEAGTLHLAWGAPPPPPPVTPEIYAVYGIFPGSGFQAYLLGSGLEVAVNGANLDIVDKIRLSGVTVLASGFAAHSSSGITFTLPDTPGLRSGPMRVQAGEVYGEATVTVLRPEIGWRTPAPTSGVSNISSVDTDISSMTASRYKTVGSSRVGDFGDPVYNDALDPVAKMGYTDGHILEQITAMGIDNGGGGIPMTANMLGTYPPAPPDAVNWMFEYQGQPADQTFSTDSPVSLKDALTLPVEVYVALTPTYPDPRLTDTRYGIYGVAAEITTTDETPPYPDTHITKSSGWFTGARLIDSGVGPNYHGDWNDGFEDGDVSDWIGVSTALSPSGGFTGGGLKATGPGEFRSPPVGATPGFSYRMDCWIGRAPARGGTVRVGIAWLDQSEAQIDFVWGGWHDVLSDLDLDNFADTTWVSGVAPNDPNLWSRQLMFQFADCASIEIDSVNFRNDGGSYTLVRNLHIPPEMIYVDGNRHLYVTLIGVGGPGIDGGTSETGSLAYALQGSFDGATAAYTFQPRATWQPTDFRYWLPLAIGVLGEDATVGGWTVGGLGWGDVAPAAAPPGAPLALRGSGTEGAPFLLADRRWWTWDNPVGGGPFNHFHIVEREAFYSGSGDVWDPTNYTEDSGVPIIDFTTSGISAGTPDGLPYAIPGHEATGGDNLMTTADSGLGVYSDRILTVTSVGPGGNSSSQKAVSRALS